MEIQGLYSKIHIGHHSLFLRKDSMCSFLLVFYSLLASQGMTDTLLSLGQKGLLQKTQFPQVQLEAVAKSGVFSQLQTGPKGCHTEKRKKRGKATAPHVNIKKKRTLANCTTGWKSPADTTWSREFWVYSFYFRKASTVSIL